jgi:hypothetical protein
MFVLPPFGRELVPFAVDIPHHRSTFRSSEGHVSRGSERNVTASLQFRP